MRRPRPDTPGEKRVVRRGGGATSGVLLALVGVIPLCFLIASIVWQITR